MKVKKYIYYTNIKNFSIHVEYCTHTKWRKLKKKNKIMEFHDMYAKL